ncbi:Glucose-6-phosphate exchanger SLC37A2 [Fragariocoptes setiger]|uniref:Sugar phosphate exchanger 3 n=1 Tax=Fragariocoptes setiger TaxID=1670756 RepID=A0ABQ7S6B1_9ACAR|nr:Glucose-6-phosphate exchanger SLC37A2 [Fragariocoptes setiger]
MDSTINQIQPTQVDMINNVLHGRDVDQLPNKPIGVALLGRCYRFSNPPSKRTFHKGLILFLTFIAYSCYHMARRPLSIVKNVLNRNCSAVHEVPTSHIVSGIYPYDVNLNYQNSSTWCDWAPFNDDATANQLLAILDSAFLFSYAFFMFFSGFLADRCNLRYFLSLGMILSGVMLYAFGMSFYFDIHSMTYFTIVQVISGAIQTTGWPAVVACLGNWFGPSSRGLVFGIWNSHTNVGNILGATIAGYFVEKSWGLSFVIPGLIIAIGGMIIFLFLVPRPEDVGLTPLRCLDENGLKAGSPPDSPMSTPTSSLPNVALQANTNRHEPSERAASFWTALRIPGVVEFSMCLFFSKLVSYTFLYWLPRYITQSTKNNSENSAYLSTPFDLGGVVGAIVAGMVSDKTNSSAVTCTAMLLAAIPAMYAYELYASISEMHNIMLQLVAGALVNGPYALITTAVSANLGNRVKDGRAMATVAAIIDGTGSIGAAVGPLFAGFVSDSGWQSVFAMLMISDLLASICLLKVSAREIGRLRFRGKTSKNLDPNHEASA